MIYTVVHMQNKIEKDLQAWIIFFIYMVSLFASTMIMKQIISFIFLSFTSNRKYKSVVKTHLPENICQRLAAFWSLFKFFFFKVACAVNIKLFFMDWFYWNLIILIKYCKIPYKNLKTLMSSNYLTVHYYLLILLLFWFW